jgi:hypothetical protein
MLITILWLIFIPLFFLILETMNAFLIVIAALLILYLAISSRNKNHVNSEQE